GAVSGMPAIRETGPGKNLQAITVSTKSVQYIDFARLCRPDKAFTPHPAVVRRCLMRRWRVLSCLQNCTQP
ncbi:hypothetical protein EXX74_20345, partial [Escherichia coli]